jgi:hypothetical protein
MEAWSDNLVTTEIKPGDKRKIAPPRQEGCLYRMRVVYRDNRFEEFGWIDLCNDSGFNVAARVALQISNQSSYVKPPAGTVTFDNRSGRTVYTLRMTADGSQIGLNRLGNEPLAGGKTRDIRLDAGKGCLFRIRATYDDFTNEILGPVDLCNNLTVQLKRDAPVPSHQVPPALRVRMARTVVLVNKTNLRIDNVHMYVGNTIGTDRLGQDYLFRDGRYPIDVVDLPECLVNVRATYFNGQVEQISNFDLCDREELELQFRGPNAGWQGPGPPQRRP